MVCSSQSKTPLHTILNYSDLKWRIHLSKNLFLYFNEIMNISPILASVKLYSRLQAIRTSYSNMYKAILKQIDMKSFVLEDFYN